MDNGISLCKNHHWAFDAGLFCINDDYTIRVCEKFQEESPPGSKPMKGFHGEMLLVPSVENSFPRLEAIQWHREHKFIA